MVVVKHGEDGFFGVVPGVGASQLDRRELHPGITQPHHRPRARCDHDDPFEIAAGGQPGDQLAGALDVGKQNLDRRGRRGAVELLLQTVGSDLVVDEQDAPAAERFTASDDDLTVDQPVVDPGEQRCETVGHDSLNRAVRGAPPS